MKTYNDLKIIVNGVELPAPVSIEVNLEDLDSDSFRDTKYAKMHRNRLRSSVSKISLSYSIDDVEKMSAVLNAIDPETFSVTVFDLKQMKRVTKTMYAGPKSYGYIMNSCVWVKAMKFNLVEV